MDEISIVTAFFDIGRGGWTPDKGLPHYLERSVDTYMQRFGHLCLLDNDITVYTSLDLVDKMWKYANKKQNLNIVPIELSLFDHMREKIEKIQKDPTFQSRVDPRQAKNPEYWNADYVLVTDLKASFTSLAVVEGYTGQDLVAWIDFGYCRDLSKIPPSRVWKYDFDPQKIHMFNYKPYDNRPIEDIALSNDVYILGAKVVAHAQEWWKMSSYMRESFAQFLEKGIVDDDQGLWLQCYLNHPEDFELHRIPDHQHGHDPFVLFNEFNKAA